MGIGVTWDAIQTMISHYSTDLHAKQHRNVSANVGKKKTACKLPWILIVQVSKIWGKKNNNFQMFHEERNALITCLLDLKETQKAVWWEILNLNKKVVCLQENSTGRIIPRILWLISNWKLIDVCVSAISPILFWIKIINHFLYINQCFCV